MFEKFSVLKRELQGKRTELAITTMLITAEGFTAPLVPIDTSNLINSMEREVWREGALWKGSIFFEAQYAAAVHEMPGTLMGEPRSDFGETREGVAFGGGTGVGNYWDPNGEPEFLETGVERLLDERVLQILEERYGI